MDNHAHHVFDPALTHNHNATSSAQPMAGVVEAQPQSDAPAPGFNPDGTPIKRRPGRPKGSTKKNLLGGSLAPPKIKRPVGRPRKDGHPAGSLGVGTRSKKDPPAAPQAMPLVYGAGLTGVGYPPAPYGFSISTPIPPAGVVPPMFQIDPTLDRSLTGDNEWAELARTNPNGFLGTLLAAIAAPNPVSSAGPTVEEAYKSHLVSLAPNPSQMQPIPSLYSILKTFWLPSSPAYFSLTASASTARTPSEHRFLYWDPQPLVFNGIACPSCSGPLMNKGRISSGPVKIYDIEKPFFIVGCEYVCRSPVCIAATGSAEGRKFASTDSSILRSLPMLLKDEFPARLLHGDADAGTGPNVWNWKAMGVSTGLWNLVIGALRAGLKKDVIVRLIWSVQHKVSEGMGEPAASLSGQGAVQEPTNSSGGPHDDHDKMGDADGDEDDVSNEDGGGELEGADGASAAPASNQSHTLSSTNFSDAYGDAWKENTAMTDSHPKPSTVTPQPQSTTTPQSQAHAAPQQPAPAVSSSSTPAPVISPMMQHTAGANPWTAYPFTFNPYSLMPSQHQLVNGQLVPMGVGQIAPVPVVPPPPAAQPPPAASGDASAASGSGSAANGVANGSSGATIIQGGSNKRSPRHCCKCGSQECKGKGGRSFCMNPCQDCGKLDCKGRNSRRPDKKCTEGWS